MYCRVSTPKQEEVDFSLEFQKKLLKEFAKMCSKKHSEAIKRGKNKKLWKKQ